MMTMSVLSPTRTTGADGAGDSDMVTLFVWVKGRRVGAHRLASPVQQYMNESIPQSTSLWGASAGQLAGGQRTDNRLVSGTGAVDERREGEKKPGILTVR